MEAEAFDSTTPISIDNSPVSSQSELESSPTERRNFNQEQKIGHIVDRQPIDSRGLTSELLSRVRNFRTFILRNPLYKEETSKWNSRSKPYDRLKELNILAAYYYDEDERRICRKSKPIEGVVSNSDFDAASLFKEWTVIQRALNTARKNNLFLSEPERSDIDTSEEGSSDGDDTRSSKTPKPVRPDVKSQYLREPKRRDLPKFRSNQGNKDYGLEWKGVSELMKAQNKQLEKQRQDMEALTEMVRHLQVKSQPNAPAPTTTAAINTPSSLQSSKHLPMTRQFRRSPHCRNPQTPPQAPTHIGDLTPLDFQSVPGAQFGGPTPALSVGSLPRQPNLPVELQREKENSRLGYYDSGLTARSDLLNFKISDIGIFEPTKERKVGLKEQPCCGQEYNVFSDVHSWIQAVDDNWSRINPREQHIVTRNLWTLLRGPAIVWWRVQLSQEDREKLQASKEKMLEAVEREFKLDICDAIEILEKSKFQRQDIMGGTSIQSFACKIFDAAKACGGTSSEHLLTRLYHALDPDLQVAVDIPKSTDTQYEYVKMIEKKINALRRKEDAKNNKRFHLVDENGYPQQGRSNGEPLPSADNDFRTTEQANMRRPKYFNVRNNLYPNTWPYELHEPYHQNYQYSPQGNSPGFQRLVPDFYGRNRRRDRSGKFIEQQQEPNQAGGRGYYDYGFGTNNHEANSIPYMTAHTVDDRVPYGFNHQRIEFSGSRHQSQDQPFLGRYHEQHGQTGYQPNETWTARPMAERFRYDSHPKLLGEGGDEENDN
ncbi:hypothetical protein FOFC_16110 [Fusarium oxysporum]|nr:hypothetical protein FOFC_16110 [Fusarium oxysporum]